MVVDVGGGHGSLLDAIVRANPTVRGVLFDQAEVTAEAHGSIDASIADRWEVRTDDFFASVPESGHYYLLKGIIHNWDDVAATRVLSNVRSVMSSVGVVLMLETVLPPGDGYHFTKYLDMNMMVLTDGGHERTSDEYAHLSRPAGLRLTRIIPAAGPWSIVEARPSLGQVAQLPGRTQPSPRRRVNDGGWLR